MELDRQEQARMDEEWDLAEQDMEQDMEQDTPEVMPVVTEGAASSAVVLVGG
jgi:hypothetical protein